ncbi:hypothetical protein K435DRAFT_792901 [Dendrothele bispora CBS 962.96]|uniref:protein-tyrosine-phosphatase n=1 Tax=Dendrothele bispora (strain CBS 962.96) TaxID=1314807 RepID=A0A4S8MID6_DENBC|nr:hypothetical protein K435DRAFT_792901 [Dendrothele bispora CBS 962.96]
MNAMDQVIPNLWLGGLQAALDTKTLKAHNIFSVLSAMRGKVSIHETFIKHQILLDDTEEEDILVHLMPAITFIQAELGKGRGVLVHCHAGVSRSATIVAAYLMYSMRIDPIEALNMVRDVRPEIDPNPGFLIQLEIFHNAAYKITRRDKTTRMFYMERTAEEVMNGDGTLPSTDMFARLPPSLPHSAHPSSSSSSTTPHSLSRSSSISSPHYPFPPSSSSASSSASPSTPSPSPSPSHPSSSSSSSSSHTYSYSSIHTNPSTPYPTPHRRIRCKLCRHELATREHMLDHGQVGPPTPASMTPASVTPVGSRRGSEGGTKSSRHNSITLGLAMTPTTTTSPTTTIPSGPGGGGGGAQPRSRLNSSTSRPRRPSGLSNFLAAGGLAGLTMSQIESESVVVDDDSESESSSESGESESGQGGEGEEGEEGEEGDGGDGGKTAKPKAEEEMFSPPLTAKASSSSSRGLGLSRTGDEEQEEDEEEEEEEEEEGKKAVLQQLEKAKSLGRRMSDSIQAGVGSGSGSGSGTKEEDVDMVDGTSSSSSTNASILGSTTQIPMTTSPPLTSPLSLTTTNTNQNTTANTMTSSTTTTTTSTSYAPPGDLVAQLHANPKLAALKGAVSITPGGGVVALGGGGGSPSSSSPSTSVREGAGGSGVGGGGIWATRSPPILVNPKCSGYFVEPGKSGKIICPNKKCGAKLGNYDWAGVCCGCKEWVVPGFCISRAKVDEVV